MKRILTVATLLTLVALTAAFAACGDDDDDTGSRDPEIRTSKGLSVAALSGNLSGALNEGDGASGDSAAAPAIGLGSGETRSSVAGDQALTYGIPALQANPDGITIVGYGMAATDADAAIVEFYFGRDGYGEKPVPEPVPPTDPDASSSSSGSSGSAPDSEPVSRDADTSADSDDFAPQPAEINPITEADLQPVIDALTGAGVARDDIEFISQGYYDPYYASATLRATIANIDSVDATAEAANTAAGGLGDVTSQGTAVSYTLSDCTALERAAMEAAAEDAGDRAAQLAEVLGVGLGAITGASQYSYAPYGGTPCDAGSYYGPYPLLERGVAPGQTTSEVQVSSEITITYAIN